MAPRCRQAIAPDTNLDSMRVHRPIVTAAHIIFTSPDQLNGRTPKSFGDGCCLARHMRIDHCPTAKTAAGEFSVKGYLLRFETEHLADSRLIHCLKL